MKLFVYGSLKRSFTAHEVYLAKHNPHFIRECKTTPDYHLYKVSWFPGMAKGSEKGEGVTGELYEIDEKCLVDLDIYESVASGLFRREEIILANGTEAVAYLYNRDVLENQLIENGVW